jgi:hypothetical protein
MVSIKVAEEELLKVPKLHSFSLKGRSQDIFPLQRGAVKKG